jgi:hypothetical protein
MSTLIVEREVVPLFIREVAGKRMTERQLLDVYNACREARQLCPFQMVCRDPPKRSYFPEHSCAFIKQLNSKTPGEPCGKFISLKNEKAVPWDVTVRGKNYRGEWVCPRHFRSLERVYQRVNLAAEDRRSIKQCPVVYINGTKKGTKCGKLVAPDSDCCRGHFRRSTTYGQFLAWRANGEPVQPIRLSDRRTDTVSVQHESSCVAELKRDQYINARSTPGGSTFAIPLGLPQVANVQLQSSSSQPKVVWFSGDTGIPSYYS